LKRGLVQSGRLLNSPAQRLRKVAWYDKLSRLDICPFAAICAIRIDAFIFGIDRTAVFQEKNP